MTTVWYRESGVEVAFEVDEAEIELAEIELCRFQRPEEEVVNLLAANGTDRRRAIALIQTARKRMARQA